MTTFERQQELAGVKPAYFILSFDIHKGKTARKSILSFIIRNEGELEGCPVESTIIFSSRKSYEYWQKQCTDSSLENISMILVKASVECDVSNLMLKADKNLLKGFENDVAEIKKELGV